MTSVLATQHSEAIASPPPHAPPFLPFLRISYTRKKKKKKKRRRSLSTRTHSKSRSS
jgi:hypothetical protein